MKQTQQVQPAKTAWQLRELTRPLAQRTRRQKGKPRPSRPFEAALVEFVHEQRFVTAEQLQRRFAERLKTYRTAQRAVARLMEGGYLATAPVRGCGPHFPAVYVATLRGLRIVQATYRSLGHEWQHHDPPEERRVRGVAADNVLHELLVSEFALGVRKTIDARDDLRLLNIERRYHRDDRGLAYRDGGEAKTIVPDLGFLAAQRGRLLPLCLVEMETGTHTHAAVRRKLDAYHTWTTSESHRYLTGLTRRNGQRFGRLDFRLLLIAHDRYGTVPDQRRLLNLFLHAMHLPRRTRDRIWLTTGEELQRHAYNEKPLDAALWIRAKDGRRFLSQLRREVASDSSGRGAYAAEREFWSKRFPHLPRHPLVSTSEHAL